MKVSQASLHFLRNLSTWELTDRDGEAAELKALLTKLQTLGEEEDFAVKTDACTYCGYGYFAKVSGHPSLRHHHQKTLTEPRRLVWLGSFGFSLGQRLEMESLNPGIKPVSPVYGTTVLRPYGNSSAFSLI